MKLIPSYECKMTTIVKFVGIFTFICRINATYEAKAILFSSSYFMSRFYLVFISFEIEKSSSNFCLKACLLCCTSVIPSSFVLMYIPHETPVLLLALWAKIVSLMMHQFNFLLFGLKLSLSCHQVFFPACGSKLLSLCCTSFIPSSLAPAPTM